MAGNDLEFPLWEDYPLATEDYPQPLPETEFRLPDAAAEDSAPPGEDFANPAVDSEFTPPGSGGEALSPASAGKRRRLRRLLYAAASCILLLTMFGVRNDRVIPAAALSPLPGVPVGSGADVTPAPIFVSSSDIPLPSPAASSEPTAEPLSTASPEPSPAPVSKEPVISTDFFCFSHEHHARVRLSNTGALHSVRVSVREKTLDKPVYEHDLSEEEIASGFFELPILSTGDFYMENMDAFGDGNGWPEFEMKVTARYENEAGDGEDTLTLTREPDFELGIGISYMRPDYNWSEFIPPDSFYFSPWAEIEEINYVINDPDAVTDPLTFSVDVSCNGRHAAPEEYELVLVKEEYTLVDSASGTETPTVSYTRDLLLRRPDWMPETGTLHVRIVQLLASTGETWVRDFDLDYPERYDWEN